MQASRLFEMVYLLLERKSMTAKALAEHFEVSKRTVLRDVETLSMAGVPIYAARGRNGGISILEGFVLNKTALSAEEQREILLALQGLTATEHAASQQLLSRLRALFGQSESWIEVDFSRWGDGGADREKFEQIHHAILERRLLVFSYVGANGEATQRRILPSKLLFKSKFWYVQGYCLLRKDNRTFKVNRMLRLQDGGLAEREETVSDSCAASGVGEASKPVAAAPIRLVLQVQASAAYRLYDEFDETAMAKNSDGSFTVTAVLPEDGWVYGFLLSLGTAVEVLGPEQVKTRLRAQVKAMWEQQNKNT